MSEGNGGVVKVAVVILGGIGMIFARFGDNLFRFGSRAARNVDNVAPVTRHLDDASFGRHLDDVPTSGLRPTEDLDVLAKQAQESESIVGDVAEGTLDAAGVALDAAEIGESDE